MPMKPFAELTGRGQVVRLRPMALKALKAYSLEVSRVRLLANDFNCIFRVDTAGGEKFILRIGLPFAAKSEAETLAEVRWLDALAHETDLCVPAPVRTKKGELVIWVESEGVPEARNVTVFTWVPGVDLNNRLTLGNGFKWGALMAHLHIHGRTLKKKDYPVLRFDTALPFPEPFVLYDPEQEYMIPEPRKVLFDWVLNNAEAAITRFKQESPMQIIHGDLHPWNILVYRGRHNPIDFEELMWGWPVQDIGTALYYITWQDHFHELVAAFKEGYQSVLPWPETHPGDIKTFIARRGIELLNFMVNDPVPSWRENLAERAEKIEERINKVYGTIQEKE